LEMPLILDKGAKIKEKEKNRGGDQTKDSC
jgi:hypothetical protein